MPEWAIVLTVVFSGIAAIAAVVGMFWHKIQSAKDAGRLEQTVAGLVEDMGRQRMAVGECQLAANCDREMKQMSDRIASAHRRMDGHETRINTLDGSVSELRGQVAALQAQRN
jgi:uncharacterized protein HemX